MFNLFGSGIFVLMRQKLAGPGTHWGVLFPGGWVYEYVNGLGLRVTTIEGFASGMEVKTVREVPWNDALSVHARLEEILRDPKRYDLLQWNCQTFANWLTEGRAESEQITGLAFIGALVVLLAALS